MMLSNFMLCLLSTLAFIAGTGAREAIVGGYPADLRYFRYHVSLQNNGKHFCNGGIIGLKFVLTAARCVVNDGGEIERKQIFVVAGTNNLWNLASPAVGIEVKKIYALDDYVPFFVTPVADIAVLKLKEPLEAPLTTHGNLRSLSLPRNNLESYGGKHAGVTGFGWTWVHNGIGGHNDTQLRFAETLILGPNQYDCPAHRVHDKQICARVKQENDLKPRGVCKGDEGAPLVIEGHLVVGVLSAIAPGCAERNSAATYTRVSAYITFIHNAKADKITKNMKVLEL